MKPNTIVILTRFATAGCREPDPNAAGKSPLTVAPDKTPTAKIPKHKTTKPMSFDVSVSNSTPTSDDALRTETAKVLFASVR